jgi:hypothetical protein
MAAGRKGDNEIDEVKTSVVYCYDETAWFL